MVLWPNAVVQYLTSFILFYYSVVMSNSAKTVDYLIVIIAHFGDESFQTDDCTGTDNRKQTQ